MLISYDNDRLYADNMPRVAFGSPTLLIWAISFSIMTGQSVLANYRNVQLQSKTSTKMFGQINQQQNQHHRQATKSPLDLTDARTLLVFGGYIPGPAGVAILMSIMVHCRWWCSVDRIVHTHPNIKSCQFLDFNMIKFD